MMASFSVSLLLLLQLLLIVRLSHLSVVAHYTPPSVAAVTIHAIDQGSVSVSLPDPRAASSSAAAPALAECSWTYRTNEGVSKKKQKQEEVKPDDPAAKDQVDPVKIVKDLEGACITSTVDYWSYELCF